MALTLQEVEQIALLARLELTGDEAARLKQDLDAILGYVDKLQRLDTTGVEPMTHAVPMDCPLRVDAVLASLPADEALAAAPRREGDFFEVPKIIDRLGDAEPGASPPAGKAGQGPPDRSDTSE